MKRLSLLFFLPLFAAVPVVLQEPDVLAYVEENLPHSGLLKQTDGGFLYISLPKEYVYAVLPLLLGRDATPPPYFDQGMDGAHITVATEEEMAQVSSCYIPNLNQEIDFLIVNISKVELENSSLGSEVYYLKVESEKIGKIRKELGLSPKIQDHDFHITIGVVPVQESLSK